MGESTEDAAALAGCSLRVSLYSGFDMIVAEATNGVMAEVSS
jgi:hypothetical protein